MNEAQTAEGRHANGRSQVLGLADWLSLAAAPTFAVMALLTGVLGSGMPSMACLAAHDTPPLGEMVQMYLLMGAFHLPPWLKLSSSRRNTRRS